LRSADTKPNDLVERLLEMAVKRERQAAAAANKTTSEELLGAAKGYRALADALTNAPRHPLMDRYAPRTTPSPHGANASRSAGK
jgi:hypothetical protein